MHACIHKTGVAREMRELMGMETAGSLDWFACLAHALEAWNQPGN